MREGQMVVRPTQFSFASVSTTSLQWRFTLEIYTEGEHRCLKISGYRKENLRQKEKSSKNVEVL